MEFFKAKINIIKKTTIISAFTLISLSINNSYAINGVFDYGYGQINRGMGGAGVASPDDAYATIINPAGLTNFSHNWDAGAAIYFPNMYTKYGAGTATFPTGPLAPPQGTFYSVQKVFFMPDISYVRHLDKKNHVGVSLNTIGGYGTRYTTHRSASFLLPPGTTTGRGVFGDGTIISSLKIGSLNASYAYLVDPTISLGLTLSFYMQQFESNGSQGLAAFTEEKLNNSSITPTRLSNNGFDYNYGVGVTGGLLIKPSNKISLGIQATPPVRMTKLKKYRNLITNGGQLDIPGKYSVGLNLKPVDKLDVNLDFVYIANSDVDSYANDSRALFDGRCTQSVALMTSANNNYSYCMGGKYGPGFGWDDMRVLKIGGAYKLTSKDTVRLGISISNRIAHPKDIIVATLAPGAVAQYITSAGYTRQFKDFKLNTFLTYIPQQSMSGYNELSTNKTQKIKTSVGGFGFGFGVSV